ncbi:MAG: glycoside hydrolase family 6 protein, partial [Solirubrobacteraceae bacterium]
MFKRRVDELAEAVDRRPAVFLLETDAIGNSSCVKRAGSLPTWESFLRYEIDTIAALPHSVAYV